MSPSIQLSSSVFLVAPAGEPVLTAFDLDECESEGPIFSTFAGGSGWATLQGILGSS